MANDDLLKKLAEKRNTPLNQIKRLSASRAKDDKISGEGYAMLVRRAEEEEQRKKRGKIVKSALMPFVPTTIGKMAFNEYHARYGGTTGMLVKGAESPVLVTVEVLPVTAGLVSWHKANSITDLNDGDAIITWPDSSGNGFTVIPMDIVGLGPIYKTNVINGKPVLRGGIGGNGGNLQNNSYPDFGAIWTVFTVAAFPIGASVTLGIVDVSSFDTTNTGFALFNDNGLDFWRCSFQNVIPAGDQRDGVFRRRTGIQRAGNTEFYRNGVSQGITSTGPNNTLSQLTIGALGGGTTSYGWQGDIAEVIIYNRDLSNQELSDVDNYLKLKYALS